MKISILIPIYKVEKYIRRCAESIFRQTYLDLEIIFVDDASPDNSLSILKDTIQSFPSRSNQIRIITNARNKGLSYVRNISIKAATGEYVFFVDSDDYIEPNTIALMADNIGKTNADIIIGNYIVHEHKGSKKIRHQKFKNKRDAVLNILSLKSPHHVFNILIRRTLFFNHHIQALDGVNYGEDHQIMVQSIYHANKISFIDDYTYHYDFTNVNSYINSFYKSITEEKAHQLIRTAQYIVKFFSNKEKEYFDKSQVLEFHYYYWVLSQLCLQGKYKTYKEIAKSFQKTDLNYWTLRKWQKPLFRIITSYYLLMRIYLLIKKIK